MRVELSDYRGKYQVFSLALSLEAEIDLMNENVICWRVCSDRIVLLPFGYTVSTDVQAICQFRNCNDYDVWVVNESGIAVRYYDVSSLENSFFITEKCNSNCLMCPSPEVFRLRGDSTAIDDLIAIAEHVPADAPHITITGGEPFMVGKELFRLLNFCREKFEMTEFLVLTNGRIFALEEYCDLLMATIPGHTVLAIPVHAADAQLHDTITQSKGSFAQTITGIKKLLRRGVYIEIRIVVSRLNYKDLNSIAQMITREIKEVTRVCIIAMEMTGSAYKNRELVWMPYRELFPYVEETIETLIHAGIDVKLYNFPLCTVKERYWMLCYKSISSWKVRYSEQCKECVVQKYCGGVFAGTLPLLKRELEALH